MNPQLLFQYVEVDAQLSQEPSKVKSVTLSYNPTLSGNKLGKGK